MSNKTCSRRFGAPGCLRLNQSVQLVRYDERGTGASVAAVESITLANLVNDVFAVLDAHGIERCVLAAESSGALTALSAALQQPQRISGLVIVDGTVFRGLDSATDPFLKGLQHAYAATLDRFVDLCMPGPHQTLGPPDHRPRCALGGDRLAPLEQRSRSPRRLAQDSAAHADHPLRRRQNHARRPDPHPRQNSAECRTGDPQGFRPHSDLDAARRNSRADRTFFA